MARGRGGPMIERPCIVDIGYIIGGDEGHSFVEKLFGMFVSWADRQGFVYDILDKAPAFGGGLKSAKISIYFSAISENEEIGVVWLPINAVSGSHSSHNP